MEKKIERIVELKIEEDDIIFDTLGLEVVSLVEQPAIEVGWKSFNKEDSGEVELKDIKHGEYTFTIDQQKEVLKAAEELGETINVDDMYFTLSKENFSITITDILKGLSVISSLTTNQAANDEGEVFYRYAGPPAERNFCKALQRLNKVFTRQDINDMESRGVNRDFGHKGKPYSIWEYKGSVYCHHYWSEVIIFRGTNNNKIIIEKGPVNGLPGTRPVDMPDGGHHPNFQFSKHEFSINEDKRIVVGPLLIPNKFIERIDESGNPYYVFFSKETIKKIAEKFFRENKHNNTDINHDEDITNKNTLLESWIVEDSVFDKSHIYGFNLPKGTWMGSYKINDEKTWELVKQKKLTGFSIAGFFLEQNGKERKAEMDLQKIINLLNEVEGE